MSKQNRQNEILKLINDSEIETQQELVNALNVLGYEVTQATVSRDIQELGLEKSVSGKTNKSRYVKPLDPKLQRLKTLFRQAAISLDYTENLIVIHTISGSANTAAMLIDGLANPEIMGTIAGDDTLLIIVKHKELIEEIVFDLREFMN